MEIAGLVAVSVALAAGGFEMRVIDRQIRDPWLKTVGDLDGDGRVDLVAGGAGSGGLVAYLNRFPNWERVEIDGAGKFSTDGEVADVDGDGRMDVVAITRGPDGVAWYRNAVSGWSATVLARRTLHDIEVADFDGDGRVDVVGRNQKEWPSKEDAGNRLYFWWQGQGQGAGGGGWEESAVECAAGEGLLAVDLDRDGDLDVVINGGWFENLGGRRWKERPFRFAGGAGWTYPNTYIASADFNGDGRLDIVMAPSERKGGRYRICWFEAPRDARLGQWRVHVVVADVETVCHFVGAGDFDGDGRADIAYAEMPQGEDPDFVRVMFNRGGRWEGMVVAETGSHSMRVCDVDGDRLPDLFGANWNAEGRDEDVKVWLNRVGRRGSASQHATSGSRSGSRSSFGVGAWWPRHGWGDELVPVEERQRDSGRGFDSDIVRRGAMRGVCADAGSGAGGIWRGKSMASRLKLSSNSIGMPFLYNVTQKVGYKQANLPDDVQLVQFILREVSKGRGDLVALGLPQPTGKFDPTTGFYIYLWQHYARRPVLDGIVSPARGMTYAPGAAWVISDLNATLFMQSRETFEKLPQNPALSPSLRASIAA